MIGRKTVHPEPYEVYASQGREFAEVSDAVAHEIATKLGHADIYWREDVDPADVARFIVLNAAEFRDLLALALGEGEK